MDARWTERRRFLENLYRKGPFVRHGLVAMAGGLEPVWKVGDWACSQRPLAEFLPAVLANHLKKVRFSEAVGDDGIPVLNLSTGTHLYAVCFGAKPHYYPDNNPYAEALVFDAAGAERVALPRLESCRPVERILEMARLVRRELGPDVVIGPPDMQTGFDTACILWDKTSLFEAMVEEPDVVEGLANKCASFLEAFIDLYYREFPDAALAHCPTTWVPQGMGPWISNDECGGMSNAAFERFCLPELISLSKRFGGLGMHCCADAPHQFPLFKKIPNFYAFNRVPSIQLRGGWKEDKALGILGGAEGPTWVPGWCTPETVSYFLEHAPAGTRFVFHSNGFETIDEGKRWLEECRGLLERQGRGGAAKKAPSTARAACACCG